MSKAVKEGRILINELKSYLSRKEVDAQNAKKMLVRAGEDTYAELFATKEGSYLGFQGKLHALKGNVFEEIKPEEFKGEGLENLEFTNELYAAVADKFRKRKIHYY